MDPCAIALIIVGTLFVIYMLATWYEILGRLNGFWVASRDFLDKASLERLILYINDKAGHLIIQDAEKTIANSQIKIGFYLCLTSPTNWIPCSVKYFTVHVSGVDSDVMPPILSCTFYTHENKLVLYNGDITHAILYKDSELTAISACVRAPAEPTAPTAPAEPAEPAEPKKEDTPDAS